MGNNQSSPERTPKLSALDNLITFSRVFALGAGIFQGYSHATGIEFDKDSFAASTLYGPTLLMAGFTSLKSVKGEYSDEGMNQKPVFMSIIGAIPAAITTAIGYGLGYTVGKIAC